MKEKKVTKNVKADRGCKRNKMNFFAWNNRMGFFERHGAREF